MVQILASMVKAEFTFFEMKQEGAWMHAPEPGQAGLGVSPEALDPVDVVRAVGLAGELISAMIHPQMLLVSQVHQAVVPAPAVGMNDTVERDFAPNRPLKHGFGAIGDPFGVDFAIAFEDAEDRRLLSSAAPGLASDASRTKVTFIDFDGAAERTFDLARLGHSQPQASQEAIDGVAIEPRQLRDLDGSEIGRHVAQKTPKNGFGDS
jgi:hypothetical protein